MNHIKEYLSFSEKEFFKKRKKERNPKIKSSEKQTALLLHPNLDLYSSEEGCC
jgi:hypothetical protein